MIILHISDIHGAVAAFKKVLKAEKFDVLAVSGDFEYIGDAKVLANVNVPVVAVHGNYESPETMDMIGQWNISGRAVDIGGWRWVGVGFGEGTVNFEPAKDLIFLTHEPPFGAGDLSWIGPVGRHDFRRAAEYFKPAFWLCGHIHEGRGTGRIGRTIVVNAGALAEKSYALVDTEAKKAIMKRLV